MQSAALTWAVVKAWVVMQDIGTNSQSSVSSIVAFSLKVMIWSSPPQFSTESTRNLYPFWKCIHKNLILELLPETNSEDTYTSQSSSDKGYDTDDDQVLHDYPNTNLQSKKCSYFSK